MKLSIRSMTEMGPEETYYDPSDASLSRGVLSLRRSTKDRLQLGIPDLQLSPNIAHPRYSTNSNKTYPLKHQKVPLQPFHGPPVDLHYAEVRQYIVMIRHPIHVQLLFKSLFKHEIEVILNNIIQREHIMLRNHYNWKDCTTRIELNLLHWCMIPEC